MEKRHCMRVPQVVKVEKEPKLGVRAKGQMDSETKQDYISQITKQIMY